MLTPYNLPVLLVFDFETTGLEPDDGAEPIELAAVALDPVTLKEVGRFPARLMKVKHPENASPEALRVNNKTIEQIMAAENPEVVFRDFANWAKSFIPAEDLSLEPRKRRRPLLLGHNVKFDITFLKWAFRQYMGGLKAYNDCFDYHSRCTFEAASFWLKDVMGMDTSGSLVKLTELLGIPHKAHEAMGDVEATVAVYRKLIELAKDTLKGYRAWRAAQKPQETEEQV